MATTLSSQATLTEMAEQLENSIDREELLRVHRALKEQAAELEYRAQQKEHTADRGPVSTYVRALCQQLRWVDEHHSFALLFELKRELECARQNGLLASRMLEPAA